MGWQNWRSQGADAGLYSNDDIHAIRIVAMDPTTDRRNGPKAGRLFSMDAARGVKAAIHVVILDRRWAVVRYGQSVPLSTHDRKRDAVDEARRCADADGSELVVFDLGGRPVSPEHDEAGQP